MPQINSLLCIGCGACEYVCPCDVIRISGKKAYVAYPEDCITGVCWLCLKSCPVDAISWKDHFDKRMTEFSPDFAWEERKRAWGMVIDTLTMDEKW